MVGREGGPCWLVTITLVVVLTWGAGHWQMQVCVHSFCQQAGWLLSMEEDPLFSVSGFTPMPVLMQGWGTGGWFCAHQGSDCNCSWQGERGKTALLVQQ